MSQCKPPKPEDAKRVVRLKLTTDEALHLIKSVENYACAMAAGVVPETPMEAGISVLSKLYRSQIHYE